LNYINNSHAISNVKVKYFSSSH